MSEEMVSLALCPFDILAMPSSHPAITSFLPNITEYQSPALHQSPRPMLTQSELERPATVPGAVHLLAILQGEHIVAGHLE